VLQLVTNGPIPHAVHQEVTRMKRDDQRMYGQD